MTGFLLRSQAREPRRDAMSPAPVVVSAAVQEQPRREDRREERRDDARERASQVARPSSSIPRPRPR
jgi:hypothetical protein